MTPKEKAEELVDLMFHEISDGTLDMKQIESMSRQCASIAAKGMFDVAYYSGDPSMIDYLKEVKQEIEKL
jgi:hypothetical protein